MRPGFILYELNILAEVFTLELARSWAGRGSSPAHRSWAGRVPLLCQATVLSRPLALLLLCGALLPGECLWAGISRMWQLGMASWTSGMTMLGMCACNGSEHPGTNGSCLALSSPPSWPQKPGAWRLTWTTTSWARRMDASTCWSFSKNDFAGQQYQMLEHVLKICSYDYVDQLACLWANGQTRWWRPTERFSGLWSELARYNATRRRLRGGASLSRTGSLLHCLHHRRALHGLHRRALHDPHGRALRALPLDMELTLWLESKNLVMKVETMLLYLKKNLKLIKEKKLGGLRKTGNDGERSKRNGGKMMILRVEKTYHGMSCKQKRCKFYLTKFLVGSSFAAPTLAVAIASPYRLLLGIPWDSPIWRLHFVIKKRNFLLPIMDADTSIAKSALIGSKKKAAGAWSLPPPTRWRRTSRSTGLEANCHPTSMTLGPTTPLTRPMRTTRSTGLGRRMDGMAMFLMDVVIGRKLMASGPFGLVRTPWLTYLLRRPRSWMKPTWPMKTKLGPSCKADSCSVPKAPAVDSSLFRWWRGLAVKENPRAKARRARALVALCRLLRLQAQSRCLLLRALTVQPQRQAQDVSFVETKAMDSDSVQRGLLRRHLLLAKEARKVPTGWSHWRLLHWPLLEWWTWWRTPSTTQQAMACWTWGRQRLWVLWKLWNLWWRCEAAFMVSKSLWRFTMDGLVESLSGLEMGLCSTARATSPSLNDLEINWSTSACTPLMRRRCRFWWASRLSPSLALWLMLVAAGWFCPTCLRRWKYHLHGAKLATFWSIWPKTGSTWADLCGQSQPRVHTWCAVWIWELRQQVMRLKSSTTWKGSTSTTTTCTCLRSRCWQPLVHVIMLEMFGW